MEKKYRVIYDEGNFENLNALLGYGEPVVHYATQEELDKMREEELKSLKFVKTK